MSEATPKDFEMRPSETFAEYNARTSALLARAIDDMKHRVLKAARPTNE